MAGIPRTIHLDNCTAPTVTVKGKASGRIDPALTHKFQVVIGDLWSDYKITGKPDGVLSFSKISGFGSSLQTEAIRQGTSPITTHTPIGITYNDVTLELAVTTARKSMAVMRWYQDTAESVFSSVARRSPVNKTFFLGQVIPRTVTIITPTHTIWLVDAWPVSASFGDFNANASEVWIYSLTLKYTGIELDTSSPKTYPQHDFEVIPSSKEKE